MSSPPPEPEHAANTAPVKHEQGQQFSWDGHQQDKIPPYGSPSRSQSTSLLTQALAARRDAEVVDSPNAQNIGNRAAFSTSSSSSTHNPAPRDQPYNGQNTLEGLGDSTTDMASTMTEHALSAGASFGRANASSVPMNLNIRDMNDVNQMLQSHRDSMNGSRGRGTSLERTEKERRIPALPKGSTNSGDTGFNTPPAPPSPTSLNSISTTPPTDGVRARYRSWRDARPGMGAEKAWSIGKEGTDDSQGGQVEKSITEAMTGVEPNNRSRKASHSLRFFKEGLPEDKNKKTDKKGKGSRASSYRGKEGNSLEKDEVPTSTPPILEEPIAESNHVGSGEEGYFDISTERQPQATYDEMKTMPAQLLAEIRKHHNLTPGASKGSSFSRSIPVTASERKKAVWIEGESSSPEKLSTAIESTADDEDAAELSSPIKSCDEEDSGEEQISSALFVPHKTPHDSPQHERDSFNYGPKAERVRASDLPRSDDSDSNTQQWLEEHEVPSREIETKYFSDEAKPQTPVPSVQIKQPSQSIERPRLPSEVPELIEAKREPQLEDAGYITKGEESSFADDDGETTPTGSLKHDRHIPKDYSHVHNHQEKSKQPLEAIELIPYRHQVGGHTTMWRFSKRAVCKQLNNRENEFYEKVERYHPHLLKFLPRYIGVLNVTFEKQQRRKSTRKEGGESNVEKGPENGISSTEEKSKNGTTNPSAPDGNATNGDDRPRMISQSMQSSSVPIPTVTFADNRHIIPTSFLQPHPHLVDPQHRSKSDTAMVPATARRSVAQSQPPLPDSDFTFRPTLTDKHAVSWGATTVNKQLRNQVFGEAFLQEPIPIHRHKKPGTQTRSLPHRHGSTLRPSISESSLKVQTEVSSAQPPEESMRRKAMKTAAERRTSGASSLAMTPISATGTATRVDGAPDADEEFDGRAGTSAPEHEIGYSQQNPTTRPRRYSSGGLRRKPTEVAENRGNLKYFVEADDAGYKGDEEDVFAMDPEPVRTKPSVPATGEAKKEVPEVNREDQKPATPAPGTMLPAAPSEPSSMLNIPRPVNPTTARTLRDQRVEYFLLLEDLTAGMKKPCIMDLKMGTRQYGVEANDKKQKSQRKKCAETTSKELGVRVCGLQVWDVKTQAYIFQDKYFGRDLKVGQEFQDALMRFLYDGVDYSSVLRHIPTILKKLSQLEVLIQGLEGYRFYAASLLMFYDGDTQHEDESDSTAGERDMNEVKKTKDIDFKIADFANCVTKEGLNINERPCPPRHPDLPDRGFLRGLRSLKSYFIAIQKDIRRKEMMGMRKTGDGDDDDDGFEIINEEDEDSGGISY